MVRPFNYQVNSTLITFCTKHENKISVVAFHTNLSPFFRMIMTSFLISQTVLACTVTVRNIDTKLPIDKAIANHEWVSLHADNAGAFMLNVSLI